MAEKKKKRANRSSYLNDFKPNVAGEYIYTGKHYRWGSDRKGALTRLWLLGGFSLAATLANGCISSDMDNYFWSLLPWLVSFVAAISVVWALVRLTLGGEKVREYVWKAAAEQLPMRSMICAVAAGVSVLGGIINLIFAGFASNLAGNVVFVVLQAGTMAVSVLLKRTVVRLEWAKE